MLFSNFPSTATFPFYCIIGLLIFNSYFQPFLSPNLTKEEICDNGLDDDDDGWIDLHDPDCDCPILEPVSLIPNPSFEDMNCCPEDISLLTCADTWIQASEATTDYLHTCGWMGWEGLAPPLPFPDGDGAVGFRDGRVIQGNVESNWKEYIGACLLNPLKTNIQYRIEFHVGFVDIFNSPKINISFFGTTDCNNLPFGQADPAFGCPTNGPNWVKLGAASVDGLGWVKADIDLIPSEDITAIAIGPDCPAVLSDRNLYYFFDNLVLAEQRVFDFFISEVEHPCNVDFTLKVPTDPVLSYQWYKNGIALVGETTSQLSANRGEGDYQVRIQDGSECYLTQVYLYRKQDVRSLQEITICTGEIYAFGERQLSAPGEYIDTFTTFNNCDSIVLLELAVTHTETDTITATIFQGEQYHIGDRDFSNAGRYEVILPSTIGCDSLVVLNLDFYQVYFPNAFTPNGDGVNDIFRIFGGNDLKEIQNLKVFDRWGALIYEKENIPVNSNDGWNGKIKGKPANNGVYIYTSTILMGDDIPRQLSGSVSLIR